MTESRASEQERIVLVGRRYKHTGTTWSEWDRPFGEVVDAIAERAKDRTASGHPDEVIEVIVVRRAVVRAEVTVTEVAGSPPSADGGDRG